MPAVSRIGLAAAMSLVALAACSDSAGGEAASSAPDADVPAVDAALDPARDRPDAAVTTPDAAQIADASRPPSSDAGSASATCRPVFASGVNLAWSSFAGDLPTPKMEDFTTAFTNVSAAGGRIVRWWLHTNGSITPGFDGSGNAKAMPAAAINELTNVLDAAKKAGVMVVLSLWSFDMLQSGEGHPNASEASDIANSKLLLTNDAARQAYIDRVLVPMARAAKGHPALYAWEIFNEPEGMTNEFGWTQTKVSMRDVQATINWFADALHGEDASARVTNGSWSFKASTDTGGFHNYYSDTELKNVGKRARGTLDFYEVHYYASLGTSVSPLVHDAAYWKLDKPVVIGEFWAQDTTDGVPRDDLFTKLYSGKYAGAWAWQYAHTDDVGGGVVKDFRWPSMRTGLANLHASHAADVDLACTP